MRNMKIFFTKTIAAIVLVAMLALMSCESDHYFEETDWTTLETVELQHTYHKYMEGKWVYQYDDDVHFIEMKYEFNTKDSTFTGYYNELLNMAPKGAEDPDWNLLWQGSFSGKWALLHSVDLNQAYIHMDITEFKNVHGLLAQYDVLGGRVLFYGVNHKTLKVTTPLTFRRIDMHHPD